VITPEYNASIPAVVKNAIDWLSRPYGEGAVTAKPLAVIGASGGRYGGVWAHDDSCLGALPAQWIYLPG
jgi:NAD(P)H-dependent FMN reductase